MGRAHREARDAQCLTDPLKKPPALVKALYDAQREKQDAWNDVAFLEIALSPVEAAKSPQGGGGSFDDHKRKEEEAAQKALEAAKKWLFDITQQLVAFGCGHCAFKSYAAGRECGRPVRRSRKDQKHATSLRHRTPIEGFWITVETGHGVLDTLVVSYEDALGGSAGRRQRYAELASNVPEAACTVGVLLYCLLEAVVTGGDAPRSDDDRPRPRP